MLKSVGHTGPLMKPLWELAHIDGVSPGLMYSMHVKASSHTSRETDGRDAGDVAGGPPALLRAVSHYEQ